MDNDLGHHISMKMKMEKEKKRRKFLVPKFCVYFLFVQNVILFVFISFLLSLISIWYTKFHPSCFVSDQFDIC